MINLFENPGVYLIEFPDGLNYVGLTQSPLNKRRRDHYGHARWGKDTLVAEGLRVYGDDAKFKMLVSCRDPHTLRILEIEFIKTYGALSPFGRNTSPGGTLVAASSAKKISAALNGRKMSPEWRSKLGQNRKETFVDGVAYPSVKAAGIAHGFGRVTAQYRFSSSNFPGWVCSQIPKKVKNGIGRPPGVKETRPRRKSF